MDALTLDQLLVLTTVAEEGSFSAAARKLGRAQSAVTYAIQKLEEQSQSALFDRTEYRPTLTDAGRALLPQAKRVLDGLADFRRTAKAFTTGIEAEVHIAVDSFVPLPSVFNALCAFSREFPDTAIRIHRSIAGIEAFFAQNPGAMAFVPDLGIPGVGIERNRIGEVALWAVAAPSHPLAQASSPLGASDMSQYFQIVLGGQHYLPADSNRGVQAMRRWYTDDLNIKRDLIRNGLGWGSLPEHIATEDVAENRLVRLFPERWDGANQMPCIPYVLARHAHDNRGLASAWLFERISADGW